MVQASVPLLLGASSADESLAKRQRRAAVPGLLGDFRALPSHDYDSLAVVFVVGPSSIVEWAPKPYSNYEGPYIKCLFFRTPNPQPWLDESKASFKGSFRHPTLTPKAL